MQNEEAHQAVVHLQDERNSIALYETLAKLEDNPPLKEVYRRMAATEQSHAARWESLLNDRGEAVPGTRLTWRTRSLIWLAKRFGVGFVLPAITGNEQRGGDVYSHTPGADDLAVVEQSHARLLSEIAGSSGRNGIEGGTLAQIEGRHRTAGGNALRAAVLGANDGLVSNFSLVMGVAGAALPPAGILLTGFAGLLAGAISMALGEWISVQSSRELYQKQIKTEKEELEKYPEEELEELALIYQAHGMSANTARVLAEKQIGNQEEALNILVRDELNIDPQELGGSAWEAALTSFALFALGAILPVIPFIFLSGSNAILLSAAFSAGGLFIIGSAITLFTGRSVLFSGTRQMLFGLAAAAVTYFIGSLLGVNLGG